MVLKETGNRTALNLTALRFQSRATPRLPQEWNADSGQLREPRSTSGVGSMNDATPSDSFKTVRRHSFRSRMGPSRRVLQGGVWGQRTLPRRRRRRCSTGHRRRYLLGGGRVPGKQELQSRVTGRLLGSHALDRARPGCRRKSSHCRRSETSCSCRGCLWVASWTDCGSERPPLGNRQTINVTSFISNSRTRRKSSCKNHAVPLVQRQRGRSNELLPFDLQELQALNVAKYEGAESGPVSKVTTLALELEGQQFYALNGGPCSNSRKPFLCSLAAKLKRSRSLLGKTLAGGEKSRCAWLKDKYGLSWQVVPTILGKLMQDKDQAKAKRVMNAMLQMSKLISRH